VKAINVRNIIMRLIEKKIHMQAIAFKCEELARTMVVLGSHIESPGQILNAVDEDNRQYIDTLIECEQKLVISEYVVQQYLKEIWNGQGCRLDLILKIYNLYILCKLWLSL
jgi:hypothetical protein